MAQFIRISGTHQSNLINIAHIVEVCTMGNDSYIRTTNGKNLPIDEDEAKQINIVLQDMGADSSQTVYDIDGTKRRERLEKKRRGEEEDEDGAGENKFLQDRAERLRALRREQIRLEREARIKPVYDKMTEQQRVIFDGMNEGEQDTYIKLLKQHNIDLAKMNSERGNPAP